MTIAEVSDKFNLSEDTLCYYERMGLIPGINRNQSRIGEYTEEGCKWVEFIISMRIAGIPIEVLVEYVKLFGQGNKNVDAKKEFLAKQSKEFIMKMKCLNKTLESTSYQNVNCK